MTLVESAPSAALPAAEAIAIIQENQAVVEPGLLRILGGGLPDAPAPFYRAAMTDASLALGIHFRKPMPPVLTDRLIDIPEHCSTITQLILGQINDSLEPSEHPAAAQFGSRSVPHQDSCSQAEMRFHNLLVRPALGGPNSSDPLVVFRDKDEAPILLRKNAINGVPSTLSLQDISVNGVFYPAGTLFRVSRDMYRPKRETFVNELGESVAAYPLGSVQGIGYLRLTAFSIPPNERAASFAANAHMEAETFENVPYINTLPCDFWSITQPA